MLWSNKFGPVYSKWLVSMATTQNLGCQKINTNLAISLLSCNIERHVTYQITTLPEFYKSSKISCLGYLVAMVTKDCVKIHLHFKFASLSVTIATAIISITLHFVRQIVNKDLCF